MFTSDDVTADALDAMADTVVTDAEWADAFGRDGEQDTATEAAYWQQVDAANDYANFLEMQAMAELDEDDDDPGYDPLPDGEPAPQRDQLPPGRAAGGMPSSRIDGNRPWRGCHRDPSEQWSSRIAGSRSWPTSPLAPSCASARIA
jgi:hypothetical protein